MRLSVSRYKCVLHQIKLEFKEMSTSPHPQIKDKKISFDYKYLVRLFKYPHSQAHVNSVFLRCCLSDLIHYQIRDSILGYSCLNSFITSQ